MRGGAKGRSVRAMEDPFFCDNAGLAVERGWMGREDAPFALRFFFGAWGSSTGLVLRARAGIRARAPAHDRTCSCSCRKPLDWHGDWHGDWHHQLLPLAEPPRRIVTLPPALVRRSPSRSPSHAHTHMHSLETLHCLFYFHDVVFPWLGVGEAKCKC